MKLTLTELDLIQHDPEIFHLPRQLAEAKLTQDDSWERVVEFMAEEGLKTTLWQTLQSGALLFDTYGSAIQEISMFWTDDREIVARVNHLMCLTDASNLPFTTQDQIQAADQGKAFERFVRQVEHLNKDGLRVRHDILADFFLKRSFHDPETMRQLAQKRAPEIHAWVKARQLKNNVAPGHTNPGQTLKM